MREWFYKAAEADYPAPRSYELQFNLEDLMAAHEQYNVVTGAIRDYGEILERIHPDFATSINYLLEEARGVQSKVKRNFDQNGPVRER